MLKEPHIGAVQANSADVCDPGVPRYLVSSSNVPAFETAFAPLIQIIDLGQSFTKSARPETLSTPVVLTPPEIIFLDDWDHHVDLWAMGCTVSHALQL